MTDLRVTLRRSGGLLGTTTVHELDATTLTDVDAHALRALVDAALKAHVVPSPGGERDAYCYEISVNDTLDISAQEPNVPAAVLELITFITTHL